MKFSEQWLREWVNPPLTTADLVSQITMAGLEVDGVEPVAASLSKVVVGEVLETSPHPNADKLQVCRVSSGEEVFQVVCGAPNARAGIKVPFALVGAATLGEGVIIGTAMTAGAVGGGFIGSGIAGADSGGLKEKDS